MCPRRSEPGDPGGIVLVTASESASTDFPPQRSRKSAPLSGGANSPSSRFVP